MSDSPADKTGRDPRADQLRAGYAPVARAYREHLGDEIAGKPLDRALLAAHALARAGFAIEARLDRAPYPDVEYPSSRTYLLARRA